MARDDGSDLGTAVALQWLAMSTPLAIAAVALDAVSGLVTGPQLTAGVAAAFALLWWVGLRWADLDRIDFLLGSVLAPIGAFFGVVVVQAALWQLLNFVEGWPREYLDLWAFLWDVIGYVAPDGGALLVFVGSFGAAGFVAVWLDRRVGSPWPDRAPAAGEQ